MDGAGAGAGADAVRRPVIFGGRARGAGADGSDMIGDGPVGDANDGEGAGTMSDGGSGSDDDDGDGA